MVKIGSVVPKISLLIGSLKKKEINASKTYSPQECMPLGLKD